MRGTEFLDLSVTLADFDSEAARRSAVSRAYYGAFHAAKELLAEAGIALPDTSEAHRKMQFCFRESAETDGIKVGQGLESLRMSRNVADYNLRNPRFRDRKVVQELVGLAQELVALVRTLRVEPAWSRFRSNVRTYAAQALRLP